MEFRQLGRSGLKVSALCLGTMQFGWTADEALSFQILDAAVEAGINFIDTADVYSRWVPGNPGGVAEIVIGKWLKQSGIPREKLVIATKVRGKMGDSPNDEGLSRQHIMQAVDASLRRLQIDYIDLYQTHSVDPNVPIKETLTALDDLVRQGKVRYIGCSNYPAWRLMQSFWTSERYHLTWFECLQPNYSLVHRAEYEKELMDVVKTYGIGVIPYSPLGGGFLSGKYNRSQTDVGSKRNVSRHFSERNWALLDLMQKMAANYAGRTVSHVALAWLLANPTITSPIIGPRSLEQLADNASAVGFVLTSEEINQLNEASAEN